MAKTLETIEQPIRIKVTQQIDSPRMPQVTGMQHVPELVESVRARAGSEAVRLGRDVAATVTMPGGGTVAHTAMSRETITQSIEHARARIVSSGLSMQQFAPQIQAVERMLRQAPLSTAPAQRELEGLYQGLDAATIQRKQQQGQSRQRARAANNQSKVDTMQHALDMHVLEGGDPGQATAMAQAVAQARAAGPDDPGAMAEAAGEFRRTSLSSRLTKKARALQRSRSARALAAAKSGAAAEGSVSEMEAAFNRAVDEFGTTPQTEAMFESLLQAQQAGTAADPVGLKRARTRFKRTRADIANAQAVARRADARQARAISRGDVIEDLMHKHRMYTDVYGNTPEAQELQNAISQADLADITDSIPEFRAARQQGKRSLRLISRQQAALRRQAAEQPRLAHAEKLQDQLNQYIGRFGNTPEAQVMAQQIAGLQATSNDPVAYAEAKRLAAGAERTLRTSATSLDPQALQQQRFKAEDIAEDIQAQRAFTTYRDRAGVARRRGSPLYHATLQQIEHLQAQAAPLRQSGLAADRERVQLLDKETQRLIQRNAEHQREILDQEEQNADRTETVSRRSALNTGMMVRSIGGRLTGFAGSIASADPATLGSTMAAGGLTAGTGAFSDVALNRYLAEPGTSRFAGTRLGLGMLVGAQALNIVGSFISGMIQKGAQIRVQAGEKRAARDLALGQILPLSGTPGFLAKQEPSGEEFNKSLPGRGVVIVNGVPVPEAVAEMTKPGYAERKRSDIILNRQREYLKEKKKVFLDKYTYGGLTSLDEALKATGLIAESGISAGVLAKQVYRGRSYDEITSELRMGAYATSLSKATGLDLGTISQIIAQQGLGTGLGDEIYGRNPYDAKGNRPDRSVLDVVGAAVQRGVLPAAAANQFASTMTGLASQGFRFNYASEFSYLANMGEAGITKGHIGNAAVNLLQSRAAASTKLGGGFGNILQDAAMLEALQKSGGDISKAMDIAKSMTSEEQMQAAQRTFGSQLAVMGAQSSLGLSAKDATKLLTVKSEKSFTGKMLESWGFNWDSSLVTQELANKLDKERMEAAPSVTEEKRITELTIKLESIATSLDSIAKSLGHLALGD